MSLFYNDMFGEHSKIETAINRLKNFEDYAIQIGGGYCLRDSGGKDSTVIKQLAIDAGVKFYVIHNHTSVDHPETVYFVRREQKRFRDMGYSYEIEYPTDKNGKRITMWSLIAKKGFPTRTRRFCCEELKEGKDKTNTVIVTGVRWAESVRRKNQRGIYETITDKSGERTILTNDNADTRQLIEACTKKQKFAVNPIVDWEDEDVWEYIRLKNLPYNPLYDKGFKRIGCIGCPMIMRNAEELDANPKYKQAYIHAIQKYNDLHPDARNRYGLTPEQWYEWWVGQKGMYAKGNITMFDKEEDDEDE